MKKLPILIVLLLAVCLCVSAAAESGVEYDEDGGIWNHDEGTYTAPDGRVVPITKEGVSESDAKTVQNPDGTYTVTSDGSYVQNPDGSVTVESGQIQVVNQNSGDTEVSNNAAWARGMGKAAIANGTYTRTVYRDPEDFTETEVTVVYLGLARSMVLLNGKKVFVDTCNLSWESGAPANKMIAVAHTKSHIRLRAKMDNDSLVMDKIYDGEIMRVIGTGKKWTMVDYRGLRGYVQTGSVDFYANEPREYKTGWVATLSGKTKGTSTVHIRSLTSGKQQQDYPVGTPLTIFDDDGKWVYIDIEGRHCKLKRTFMIYDNTAMSEAK